MRLLLLLAYLLVFVGRLAYAQDAPKPEINLDAFIQEIFPQPEDELNYEKIYETLFLLYTNPLDLNKATREDLQSLFVLSERQINSFLKHRQANGALLSLYELQSIDDFDLETIYKVLPFVRLNQTNKSSARPLYQRIAKESDAHYLLLRASRTLEQQLGYTDSATASQRYAGSPERLYARYRISQTNDYSLGFTVEKDAGEKGADFLSYHAYLKNMGKLKTLALGDFQAQFGQGLVFSAGFSVGKGAETVQTLRRANLGLLPYSSTLESGFFRGVGATYQIGNVEVTALYSRLRRDGAISDVVDTLNTNADENIFVETLRTTGFHRTPSEIAGKNAFLEQSAGANILYSPKKIPLQIGLAYLYTQYDRNFKRGFSNAKDSLRFLYEFAGKENANVGISANYQWQNFSFFGEMARSSSGGMGGLGGFVASLSTTVDMSFLYRRYDRNFHTFYGNAFGENTRNINETGWYWGIKYAPNRRWKFAAYYDRFYFPWLRFRTDRPSEGYEYLGRVTHQISRKISLYAQMREEVKDRNVSTDQMTTNMGEISATLRRNYLLNLDYKAEKVFTFRSRLQYNTFRIAGKESSGLVLMQDIAARWGKVELEGRYALFQTDDFDTRQYVYEQDVLWAFSFPAYNGQGARAYLMMRYAVSKKIDIWVRYARFDYRKQEDIGSGGEQIAGNTRSELKLQMRIRLK